MTSSAAAALACGLLLASLPAQKVPLADGSGREVLILDVGAFLPPNRGLVEPPPAAGRSASTQATTLQRLAAFVRAFAAPGESPADLQALGERHLVAMGSPQQIATAERLLTRARQDLEKQYLVDLRLCEVPAALFERDVAPLLPKADGVPAAAPAPHATVLDDAAARALVTTLKKGADVKITQFPQIVAPSLHLARLRVGDQVAYVRDFEIEVAAAAFIANPIVDVLFHGYDVDLMCCEVRAGTLGVQLQLVDQVLEQPIRTIETTVPGSTLPVTVQVPRLAGCRGSQTVEMQNGATAVMAARKNATTWLVSLMTPQQIRSAPAALPVRR